MLNQGLSVKIGAQERSSRMSRTVSAALNFRPPVETTIRPRRFFNTALASGTTKVGSTLLPMTSALKARVDAETYQAFLANGMSAVVHLPKPRAEVLYTTLRKAARDCGARA